MTDQYNKEPDLTDNFNLDEYSQDRVELPQSLDEVVDEITELEVTNTPTKEPAPEDTEKPVEPTVDEAIAGLISDSEDVEGTLDTATVSDEKNIIASDFLANDYLKTVWSHPITVKYSQSMPTVRQISPICKEEKNFSAKEETIALPSIPQEEMYQLFEDAVPLEVFEDTSEENLGFISAIEASKFSVPPNEKYREIFHREGSQWEQTVPSQAGTLNISTIRPNQKATSGISAVFQIVESFGLGGRKQIPLWHSGFWVTLESPSEVDQLDFEDRFLAERVDAARNTYGRVFSNQRAFLTHHLLEFILQHVSQHTIDGDVDLREYIKIQDIPILALGFAELIWPNGWQYVRASIGKDNLQKTKHQRLNIARMCLTDLSQLTDSQRTHMSKRREKQSVQQIKDYTSQFKHSGTKQIDVAELGIETSSSVKFNLRIPSAGEHINSGMRWINDVISLFDSAPTIAGGEDARNKFVNNRLNATVLRNYEHFIESIEIDDKLIDNQETISAALDRLSAIEALREALVTACDIYITDSTISLAGIPTDDEDEVDIQYPRFPNTIPVDPVYLFFIQLAQRNRRIRTRSI